MDENENNSAEENWKFICSTEEFQVPLTDYVGRGSSANVYRYESSGNVYAVKLFEFEKNLAIIEPPPKGIENVKLLLQIKHENIVKLCKVKKSDRKVFLFFEFMGGGTLKTLVKELNAQKQFVRQEDALKYTAQILKGLDYLHARSIAHRDIKPENLLLNSDRSVVKVADFNHSKQIASVAQTSVHRGTLQYMAPEVLRCEKYNVKSDIWSVGATLVELLSGFPPFSSYEDYNAVYGALRQVGLSKPKPDYNLAVRNDLTQECSDLLEEIFQQLSIRPSATELLDRDCFRAFDQLPPDEDNSSIVEYNLDMNNKGKVLIINIQNYVTESKLRKGSQEDVYRLKSVFELIRFKTKVETDLDGGAIVDCIRSFLTNEETRKASSHIIVIMAHGSNDAVLGSDEKYVTWKSILELLYESTDKSLEGKPKLLLIQACRKDSAQLKKGKLSLSAATTTQSDSSNVSMDESLENTLDLKRNTICSLSSNALNGDKDSTKVKPATSKSDVIVAYSTFSNDASFRHETDGSFYIQSFCDCVRKYWKKYHVLDILTVVHRLTFLAVKQATNSTQVPQLIETLHKQYFFSHPAERKTTAQSVSSLNSVACTSNTQPFLKPSSMSSSSSASNEENASATPSSPASSTPSTASARTNSPPPAQYSDAASNAAVTPNLPANPTLLQTLTKQQQQPQQQQQQEQQVLILAGGFERKETLAYDPSSDTWAQVASMSCQRHRAAATLWQGKVVVAGGKNSEQIIEEHLKTVEMFDPETNSWTALPALLHRRSNFALVSFKSNLFAIGGYNGNGALTSVEQYNSDTKRWKLSAPLNFRRFGHCCAVLKVGILAAGGWNQSNFQVSCELFDGKKQKWNIVASLRTARSDASAATQDDKVYVFGGKNINFKTLNSIEQYDYATNKWTLLPVRLSVPRYGLAAATVNGRVYVCSGDWSGGRIVECFDARTMQVCCVSPLREEFSGGAAAAVPVTNQMLEKMFGN